MLATRIDVTVWQTSHDTVAAQSLMVNYTVSQKNDTDVAHYNFSAH